MIDYSMNMVQVFSYLVKQVSSLTCSVLLAAWRGLLYTPKIPMSAIQSHSKGIWEGSWTSSSM